MVRSADRVASEPEALAVAGQLEIAAADRATALVERAHCAFPVERASAAARIVLLIVQQRTQRYRALADA